jgi:hypothetical protein
MIHPGLGDGSTESSGTNRTGDAERKESAAESFRISIWAPTGKFFWAADAPIHFPSADPAYLTN